MTLRGIARRYAGALFDVVTPAKDVSSVERELTAVGQIVEDHAELKQAFESPAVPAARKRAVLEAVLDAGDAEPPLRAMWQELHRGELDLFTVFTRYLRAVKTHSYPDIELSPAEARYPVIVFSHAIVSFAEQNTLLMEHLASQGYVVLAISHPYASARVVSSQGKAIYPAMAKINEGSDQIDAVSDEMAPRIEQAGNEQPRVV